MMHPVMRRGNKNKFKPAEFVYFFGMHKNAPNLRGCINKGNINRPEATQSYGNKINKAIKRLHYRRTKSNRQVEFGRRMMCNMRSPKEPARMINPVQPVIHKIFKQQ